MTDKHDQLSLDSLQARARSLYVIGRWYLRQIVTQFIETDCPSKAASLTYTTLFAVVPLMTVVLWMFSIMPEFAALEEKIQEFIFSNFVPDSSAVVQEKLLEFADRARRLTAVGFVFLFVTAFMLLVTIEGTFNDIWQVRVPRRGLQRILVYWGVLSLGPSMILLGILISAYLASLPLVSDLDLFGPRSALLGSLPSLLTWFAFTILYVAMPNCRVRLFHAFVGGFLAMLSFEGAKIVFNSVVVNTSIAPIYGTFAAVPFFLVWMYMVWVLVLCGAIVVRAMSLNHEYAAEHDEPMLVKCSRVLEMVLSGHAEGRAITEAEISNLALTPLERERVFGVLKDLRVLTRDDEDRWLLGRSLKTLTLWDLYQKLPEGLDADGLSGIEGMDHVVEPLKALVQFGSNQMSVSLDSVFGGTA